MNKTIIHHIQSDPDATIATTGFPPGFVFDVTSARLFVVGPMNPEWSETTRLSEGMRIEVFAPAGRRGPGSPLVVLEAGSPSAVTFRQRVPVGTPTVQYRVTVRDQTSYLLPAEVVEVEPTRGKFANITFGSGDRQVNLHLDIVQ